MKYELEKVRGTIDRLHIVSSSIAQTIDKPDATQVLKYKGLEVYFYLRKINAANHPYLLMVIASPKKGELTIELALKIYDNLGIDLKGKSPVEILEILAQRFGYKVTVGSKTS